MSHKVQLENKKYRNWVKAGLGTKYVKDGLAPFCDQLVNQQHSDILTKVKKKHNLSVISCRHCDVRTLQPDHVRTRSRQCPLGQINCNCQHPGGKIACPNNVCGAIYDEIIQRHACTPPAPYWKNTNAQQWCTEPWAIAKCFINTPGYEQKISAVEFDCPGLLHVLMNNIEFQHHIKCRITGTDVFSRVRKSRNEIFHSHSMELEDTEVNIYIDDMIELLEDEIEIKHRQESKDAVKNLRELKQEDFIISITDEAEIHRFAMAAIREKETVLKKTIVDAGNKLETKAAEGKHELEGKGLVIKSELEQTRQKIRKELVVRDAEIKTTAAERKHEIERKGIIIKAELEQKGIELEKQLTKKEVEAEGKLEQKFQESKLQLENTKTLIEDSMKNIAETKQQAENKQQASNRKKAEFEEMLQRFGQIEKRQAEQEQIQQKKRQQIGVLPVRKAAVQQQQLYLVEGITEQITTKSLVTVGRQNCIITLDWTSGEIYISNVTGKRYGLDQQLLRECRKHLCDDSTLNKVRLIGINIGNVTVNITLSNETVIKLSETGPKGTTEEILRQLPEQTEFDKDDFETERALNNAIGQHVILDRVCCKLIDHHSATLPVVYAYPAYDESYQVTIVCLLNETFNRSSNKLDRFRNFPVKLAPYYPLSKESLNAESLIDRNDKDTCTNFKDNLQLLNEIVSEHVDSLMMKHNNLEAIKVSNVNSHEINVDISSPCIVFFCRCKSYIPYGEASFPKILRHPKKDIAFPTDVREGYYISSTARIANEYNKEMTMGCSIGTQNEALSATLGPFVEIKETSDVCFLTVRHLFPPPQTTEEIIGTKLVQPAVLDMTVSDGNQVVTSAVTGPSTVCGEVKTAEINDNVDAALVKIEDERLPKRGHFISVSRRELEFAGFSEQHLPRFEDGSTMDARVQTLKTHATDRVIKFGKRTGLTKGYLSLSCMAVKHNYSDTGSFTFQGRQYTHFIKNQLQVDSFAAQNAFFQEGDSGSSVFLVDKDNRLYCIGMGIGVLSDNTCVVTPIQNILHVLGGKLNKTLEIKAFSQ